MDKQQPPRNTVARMVSTIVFFTYLCAMPLIYCGFALAGVYQLMPQLAVLGSMALLAVFGFLGIEAWWGESE